MKTRLQNLLSTPTLKKIKTSLFILSGAFLYGGLVIAESNHCTNPKHTTICNQLISPITEPARVTFDGVISGVMLIRNGTTSGMVANNRENLRERFSSLNSGFNFNYPKGSNPNAGYILLSRADPENSGFPKIELWDLNEQKAIKTWNLDKAINKITSETGKSSFYFLHPAILNDGALIFNTQRGSNELIKINSEGDIIKSSSELSFHHSINIDSSNNIYASITTKNEASEQGFAILDQNLNLLHLETIDDIYKRHGISARLYSSNADDPIHINDVQPLEIQDGNKTEKVLISLRSPSSVLSYDISKKKIDFIFDGLTSQQHDVDIISHSPLSLSIFDNNVEKHKSFGNKVVFINEIDNSEHQADIYNLYSPNSVNLKNSDIRITTVDFKGLGAQLAPKTISSGLSEYNKGDGSIIIEESNYGRLFSYDPTKERINWTFINADTDKQKFWRLSWSRFYQEDPLKKATSNSPEK